MGIVRRMGAALAVVLVAGVVAPHDVGAAGIRAGQAPPGAEPITVTPLTGPLGAPLDDVITLNERGQVIATAPTPLGVLGGIVWERGTATYIAPWWAPWSTLTQPQDIADQGQVVGANVWLSWTPPYVPSTTPFSWQEGNWVDLPMTGTNYGTAWAVNSRGQVIGTQSGVVAWVDGQRVAAPPEVGAGNVSSMDLNDRGQAVIGLTSYSTNPVTSRVVVWEIGGRATEIDLDLPPDTWVSQVGINERSQVMVSALTLSPLAIRNYLWDGEVVDLSPIRVGGASGRNSKTVNDHGHIIGLVDTAEGVTHGVLWRDGETTDLGTLGGDLSVPMAINNHDEIVGYSTTADGEQHAFLWRDGEIYDLGVLAGEGMSRAHEITDSGYVLGTLTRPDGTAQDLLWTVRLPRG